MKNINIGIVNMLVSNKLKDAYFSNTLIEETKQITNDFFDTIKNSPILQLEFKVFNNLENKHISEDLTASRYIDSNIKLFEVYTLSEIEAEHQKLLPFLTEGEVHNNNKLELYTAIGNLIKESLSNYEDVDVDDIHESFTVVLNHIKSPKKVFIDTLDLKHINEDVVEIAVEKFNERYQSLSEEDRTLFTQLINYNEAQKFELLENYKSQNLSLLESLNKETVKESISKAIKKINEMKNNPQTVDDDIIGLHELKKGLL